MNILVFGKDGQLGKTFQEVLGRLGSALIAKLVIQYVGRSECDLSNEEALNQLLNQFQPQFIINASAYTAVDKAETDSFAAFAINARAPEIMAQYAANHGATFLHFSTDYVFDGEKYGFYLEDDLLNPLGVYGKSKAAGEEAIARAFFQVKGIGQYAIFRTSWIYGGGSNFIRTILRLAKDREELKIIDDQFGVPTSANWLAQVSLNLALDEHACLRRFVSGIYHAVPAGETTWHGLGCLAVQVALDAGVILKTNPDAIKPILAADYPLPAPRPMNSTMSSDKLRLALSGLEVNASNSYNDSVGIIEFPEWDVMVRKYVISLARDQLI
ncbi:dTDP-4-dehydrorhamnose reductase [Polynucleobacter sp. AM-7D1]|uniref:dTDP-4-dehydrorhamnose reductase n=1 Tax=Polynucleobacter sp. AM-7D1 TaxID=2689102 RepID=UPI001BFD47E9|nr:dTDP-4-dehydrorhamnose reductase [Polynucleobacter sp. AM-7D1]QWE28944.1 dTDP-4-dehydrorhamnose reductase [Polynucleobacter sp. AM-7D1]